MFRKFLFTFVFTTLILTIAIIWLQPGIHASDALSQTLTTTSANAVAISTTAPITQSAPLGPILIDRYPAQGYLDYLRQGIGLTFDRPMSRTSIAAALRIEPPFPFRLSVYANTANIEPRQPLIPGTHYHFTLTSSATDVDGIPLDQEYTWDYHLPSLINTITGPTLYSPTAPIQIYFNYALEPQRVKQALTITPTLEGKLSWNDANTIFIFTPATPLANDIDYVISFQGELRDQSAEAQLPPPAPQYLSTASPIVAVSPIGAANYGAGAHPATPIQVTFDRPMDQAQVVAALHISPTIAGDFAWQGQTVSFLPTRGYFDPYTNYIITLDAGINDSTGEAALARPFTWSFRTGMLSDVTDFGWGANVQLVDADGRRAVQYQVLEPELASVEMRLYRLSFDQFRERYVASQRGNGWTFAPISTEGVEEVKRWQVTPQAPPADEATGGNTNAREVILPPEVEPGLYIFEVAASYSQKQIFLLVTRAVIALKQARGQAVAWVTDMNGANLADVEVTIYAQGGAILGQGRTDAQGIFRTALDKEAQPWLVVARTPGPTADNDANLTAVGLSAQWSTDGGWWSLGQAEGIATDYTVYLYTDRPIYRPGQTVYFKGIVRRDEDAILSLPPAGTPVTLRLRDAKDNVVQSLGLTTNDFGTVNGEFQVAEGAVLGDYAVELVIGKERHRQIFKVEEYRKPDFTVNVTTDAPTYVQGNEIQVQVESRYLFDEPVASAPLTITKFLLQPRNYGDESDGYTWYNSYEEPRHGVTNATGQHEFTLPSANVLGNSYTQRPDWQGSLAYQTWGIEVTVDDGSHQTVSSFALAKVYNAAEKVRFDTGGYVKAPYEEFTVQTQVTTLDDQSVAGRLLTLAIDQISWENGEKVINVYKESFTTDEQGRASQPMLADLPGYYRLTVSGADTLGNPIRYESWIYVFAEDASGWLFTSDQSLRIAADRASYSPGDNAELLIESSFSGVALLAFERGTTRREQLVQLTAPLTKVRVPIQADDAPNIFVTVNAWQPQDTTLTAQTWSSLPDSRLRTAKVELEVAVINKRLTLEITPDQTTYLPRSEASFKLKVTDETGQPVQAELSLALVDEAIFSLSDELSGPIFAGFYHKRAHLVHSYNGLAPTRWFSGGGGGGGGEMASPRSDFPDTAIWIPVLQTDANGEAKIMVTLPDSLTTWRLTAKAVTAAETQVGEAFTKIVTQQPLVVRPILPRALTAGDQVDLSAVVHNYSDAAQTITVSLALSDTTQAALLEVLTTPTQTIQLEPGASQIVGWGVQANGAGEVALIVQANGEEEGDAVRLPLSIRPLAIPDVQSQVGDFTGEFTTVITLPENALDQSHLTIELNRSIAGSLLNGLEYLTGYPYGCVEQTMSRALPNAVVGRAFHDLGVNNQALQSSLPALINAGLQQLYGLQHEDGGWGWWYDDESDSYQTAWVVFGLAVMRDAGNEVDPGVIDLGVAWLRPNLASMDLRTRAFALYSMAMAGQGDLASILPLFDHFDKLDPFSQAAAVLALHKSDNADARQVAPQALVWLIESAQSDNGLVYWPNAIEDGHYAQKIMASTTRTTALVLSAFVQIVPDHPLIPGIVRWLMSQRRQSGWGSTNETAFTILALTDYLHAVQTAATPNHYQLLLNGEEIAQGELTNDQPQLRLEIPAQQLRQGANQLRLEQSGDGRLYYLINNQTYIHQAQIAAAGVIKVARTYRNARNNRPLQQIEPGQLVKVELTVEMPTDAFYMIVEDKLPGGLEALNERLNSTSRIANAYDLPTHYWRDYGYNNKEVRSDRVSFFITELHAGRHTYSYFARATHAGAFVAMPAEAYAMYDVTNWGRSSSQTLTVSQ